MTSSKSKLNVHIYDNVVVPAEWFRGSALKTVVHPRKGRQQDIHQLTYVDPLIGEPGPRKPLVLWGDNIQALVFTDDRLVPVTVRDETSTRH